MPLGNLKKGKPVHGGSINMDEFMEIADLPYWADIEKKFEGKLI
ncbi:hypothetical protein [Mucilaginibacter sp. L3T2-6]|nr:hypothetical protein [Mucilaginibacter sp. L3T2-6]MDO3643223.1 hypothetical protein [Mucilaginibacter sp. L3T2-6]MDV6215547.1 hypothetical protein [Mucilaginibacter sp. L3T2-6]